MKKVSVVTVTQVSRFVSLLILKEILEYQTYSIYEWVIVEGSRNKNDAEKNKKNIEMMKSITNINIKYVDYVEGSKLGALRNRSNDNVSADSEYIICFDDDDYYFPSRISHTVDQLSKSDKLIAGCQDVYVYDYILKRSYYAGNNWGGWSANCTLGYKYEYLKDHRYDDYAETGEETLFCPKNLEEILQLDYTKMMVLNSHSVNTYNKRSLLVIASLNGHQRIKQIDKVPMPDEYFNRYLKLYRKEEKSKYDIVYYGGFLGIEWDPTDQKLGGSEQAIVQLSKNFALEGYKVGVFAPIKENVILDGVDYIKCVEFPFHHQFERLILWRDSGLLCGMPFDLKANKIYLDLHDTILISQHAHIHKICADKFTKIFFKSKYHLQKYEEVLQIKLNNAVIIENGTRKEQFEQFSLKERDPYRFVYCSCYTRGLKEILKYIWPKIHQKEPLSELHIYYGMDLLPDDQKKELRELIGSTLGVMDHGRQPVEVIAREKYRSSYHLYLSVTELETDCISLKESVVCGCIPLINNHGVFAERVGVHLDTNDLAKCVMEITDLMNDSEKQKELRLEYFNTHIKDWEDVSKEWISLF